MKHKLHLPILAFFSALVCWITFLAAYKTLGYGNDTLLRGDLYAQYIDFISMFLRVLRGEESFWYSFSLFLGSGSVLSNAYYCLTPFNLLYLLDFISIPAMTAVIIGLKFALAAATFSVFCEKVLKRHDIFVILFSLCYAFNSFSISFYFNMIWLDALYMLPILTWLLFELVDQGRWRGLIFCWFYLFLTNFYMAYTLGIFALFTFILLLILRTEHWGRQSLRSILHRALLFALPVLLAAGLCAFILLPSALFIFSHMAGDNFEFEELRCSIPDIINAMFIGVMPNMDNATPLLYCGIPALLLLPFYFMCRSFRRKERLLVFILLLFFMIGMMFLPLFMALHAFDYPNWYSFRFSYIVCFVICAVGCRMSDQLDAAICKKLPIYVIGLLVFFSFMKGFWPLRVSRTQVTHSQTEFYVNAVFLLFWCILLILKTNAAPAKTRIQALSSALLPVLLISELTINGTLCMQHTGLRPLSEAQYNTWYSSEKAAIQEIKKQDPGFYRISVVNEFSSNAPAMFGYAGFNTFSTSDVYDLRMALHGLGICAVNRAIEEYGYTPVTFMLLGQKYTVSLPRYIEGEIPTEAATITRNDYALPLGYMVSDAIENYSATDDPFANQEQLLRLMTGRSYDFYDEIPLDDIERATYNMENLNINGIYTFSRQITSLPEAYTIFGAKIPDGQDFYACFTRAVPEARDTSSHVIAEANGYNETPVLSYGCIHKGKPMEDVFPADHSTVTVYFSTFAQHTEYCDSFYFVRYHDEELSDAFRELNRNGLQIDSFRSDLIKGSITATPEKNILFTTIPLENGWSATVDGSPAEICGVMDNAFTALRLTPGTHEIVFRYTAPGSRTGAVISLLSLLLTILALVFSSVSGQNKRAADLPQA